MGGFKNAIDVPVPLEELEREYCRLMGFSYPIKEMLFARSWMLFRVGISHSLSILLRHSHHPARSYR